MTSSVPPAGPAPDDEIRRLEVISQELKARDDGESDRQKTADSKLLSALAALPIVIALSTSAFVPLLPYAARMGGFGMFLMFLFFGAIIMFLIAALKAIIGLWPMRAKYAAIGMRTLTSFATTGTYPDLLRKIISERGNVVRNNKNVNSDKLGLYADAALCTVIGLVILTFVVLCFVIDFAVGPMHLGMDASNYSPKVLTSGSDFHDGSKLIIEIQCCAHCAVPQGSAQTAQLRRISVSRPSTRAGPAVPPLRAAGPRHPNSRPCGP